MTHRRYPAEFVFPGHPDKLCDAIADSLVLEASLLEKRALTGVEIAIHRNHVFVTGRVACEGAADIDVGRIVRDVYTSAGYGDGWYPGPADLVTHNELCLGPLEEGEAEFRALSDDQAICIGYAADSPATNFVPVEQWLVRHLARRLHRLRMEYPDLQLGPDGKVIVVVGEGDGDWALEDFSCSLQQKVTGDAIQLHRAVRLALSEALGALASQLPGLSDQVPDRLWVNGAGAFEVGGPEGDNGLAGKKLVMDAYGPRVPIGGGAWSGKDFFKADRAGGLHARRLAKLIVELGLAAEAKVVLGFYPGDREARIFDIVAPGFAGNAGRVARFLDLSLQASGEAWSCNPALPEIARWGHFSDPGLPWEGLGLVTGRGAPHLPTYVASEAGQPGLSSPCAMVAAE